MKPGVSRRLIAVFLVLLLTSVIATSVAAMGLALRKAQQSSREEELRRMGCDIVDVNLASRVFAESDKETSLAMYRSVGLIPAFAGSASVADIMMQSFLWAGEFPQAFSAPSANATKAVGPTSMFSPADLEAMQRIPGVRDVWDVVEGVRIVALDIGGTPQNVIGLPMQQGQVALWNFAIERGRDFAAPVLVASVYDEVRWRAACDYAALYSTASVQTSTQNLRLLPSINRGEVAKVEDYVQQNHLGVTVVADSCWSFALRYGQFQPINMLVVAPDGTVKAIVPWDLQGPTEEAALVRYIRSVVAGR